MAQTFFTRRSCLQILRHIHCECQQLQDFSVHTVVTLHRPFVANDLVARVARAALGRRDVQQVPLFINKNEKGH